MTYDAVPRYHRRSLLGLLLGGATTAAASIAVTPGESAGEEIDGGTFPTASSGH